MGVKFDVKLKEEHRLQVFENKVLKRIFGATRKERKGGCTNLHTDELCNLYSS
jgi:hypothetical protein